jgi:hypothetical protein
MGFATQNCGQDADSRQMGFDSAAIIGFRAKFKAALVTVGWIR